MHLELEIAANMSYEWVNKFIKYCQDCQTFRMICHALGREMNDDVIQKQKVELQESSNAIMALSTAMDFQQVNVEFPCLHRRMFYLGIAFITNSQVMQTCQEELNESPDAGKSNYLYIVNEEQSCIHDEMEAIFQHLNEKEEENASSEELSSSNSQTETESQDSET